MRTRRLVRHLCNTPHDHRLETERTNVLLDARVVHAAVDVQDVALRERLHAVPRRLERHRADLRRDREVEARALADLGLDPHVAVHERH